MAFDLTHKIAMTILARDGTAGIKQLQVAAAFAHRTGYPDARDAILEIADAAEKAWLSAGGRRRGCSADERSTHWIGCS
jgi:hypothetical protein